MGSQETPNEVDPALDRLTFGQHVLEVLRGIGLALGMTLLWTMEIVRDAYFRLLDRWNIKARRRGASAFPPGKPPKKRAG